MLTRTNRVKSIFWHVSKLFSANQKALPTTTLLKTLQQKNYQKTMPSDEPEARIKEHLTSRLSKLTHQTYISSNKCSLSCCSRWLAHITIIRKRVRPSNWWIIFYSMATYTAKVETPAIDNRSTTNRQTYIHTVTQACLSGMLKRAHCLLTQLTFDQAHQQTQFTASAIHRRSYTQKMSYQRRINLISKQFHTSQPRPPANKQQRASILILTA